MSAQSVNTLSKQNVVPNSAANGDLRPEAVSAIGQELHALLADVFTLYLKTKNFHWHMSGPHFRDFHLLLDDHGDQLFAMTDDIAERARKIGARTVHSIGDISQYRRLGDNDEERVAPRSMLSELRADNRRLTVYMRATHTVCDEHGDVATASLLENWIDETERRAWFLSEITAD